MRRALITVIMGHDGACLAYLFLSKDFYVHGIKRAGLPFSKRAVMTSSAKTHTRKG